MAATATIGVFEELMFQFDDLGDLDSSTQPADDEPLSPPSDEQNCEWSINSYLASMIIYLIQFTNRSAMQWRVLQK